MYPNANKLGSFSGGGFARESSEIAQSARPLGKAVTPGHLGQLAIQVALQTLALPAPTSQGLKGLSHRVCGHDQSPAPADTQYARIPSQLAACS